MKTKTLIIVLCIVVISYVSGQSFDGMELIAYYPLKVNANDTLGLNDPVELTNITFEGGGIYCNGKTTSEGNDWCDMYTPLLKGFSFKKFAVSVMFKMAENVQFQRPIIVGGASDYRWMCIAVINDTTVSFGFNDNYTGLPAGTKFTINDWHTVTVLYDSSQLKGEFYYDSNLVDSYSGTFEQVNDKYFGITHGGTGDVYKGYLKDLKIYSISGSTDVSSEKTGAPAKFSLQQNYPNPFNGETVIPFTLNASSDVSMKIYNIKGEIVKSMNTGLFDAGTHKICVNGQNKYHMTLVTFSVRIWM